MGHNAGLQGRLSADLLAFVQKGISVSVASRDRRLVPSVSRALACVASEDGRQLRLLVVRSQAVELVRDLECCGAIAVGFTEPSTHRTLQIKGGDAALVTITPRDQEALARSEVAFGGQIEPLGFDQAYTRRLFSARPDDLVVIAFTPDKVYQQTPGRAAGALWEPGS